MSDLSVEHVITVQIVLVEECGLVFAEIVEYLEDSLGLHDFSEPMLEGIHLQQVKQVALARKVHLLEGLLIKSYMIFILIRFKAL